MQCMGTCKFASSHYDNKKKDKGKCNNNKLIVHKHFFILVLCTNFSLLEKESTRAVIKRILKFSNFDYNASSLTELTGSVSGHLVLV